MNKTWVRIMSEGILSLNPSPHFFCPPPYKKYSKDIYFLHFLPYVTAEE